MKNYIIKKIALLIPMLIGITLITFALTKSLPGDPVYSMVGERADKETVEKIRKEIGADRNVMSQYLGYLALLIKGEMGRSYYTNRKVFEDITDKFPNTLKLALGAMIIAVPLGLMLGFISALKKNRAADLFITGISITGLSIPVFWSGLASGHRGFCYVLPRNFHSNDSSLSSRLGLFCKTCQRACPISEGIIIC